MEQDQVQKEEDSSGYRKEPQTVQPIRAVVQVYHLVRLAHLQEAARSGYPVVVVDRDAGGDRDHSGSISAGSLQ